MYIVAFAGSKSKSPQVTLKSITDCKDALEVYLNSDDEPDDNPTNRDHTTSLSGEKDLPKNLLNLLMCKLRQYLKDLVTIHMKKR